MWWLDGFIFFSVVAKGLVLGFVKRSTDEHPYAVSERKGQVVMSMSNRGSTPQPHIPRGFEAIVEPSNGGGGG